MTVRARTLWLAAFGAAVAWSVDLLVVASAGPARCILGDVGIPRFATWWWVLLGVTMVATMAGLVSLLTTIRALRAPGPEPTAARVRFMAFGGLLLNSVFLAALAFSVVALFLVPVCW